MAVVKIFDSNGVKTLVLAGNAMEQPYDVVDVEIDGAPEVTDAPE